MYVARKMSCRLLSMGKDPQLVTHLFDFRIVKLGMRMQGVLQEHQQIIENTTEDLAISIVNSDTTHNLG